jgi:enoyl-CoA hydratase
MPNMKSHNRPAKGNALNYDSYEAIKAERNGRILTLTMSRPGTLNAVDAVLHEELSRIFYDVNADSDVDVVVLTGEGNAFCAGGDLQWLNDMHGDPAAFAVTVWEGKRLINGLLDLEKPIIARLPGHAIGLGCTIALFCDIIYAVEETKLGDPHVLVGLVAGDGGAVIWPQLIGYARAKEYLMTGDTLRLAGGAINAIKWTKASVNAGLKQTANAVLDTAFNFEAMSQMTDDHRIATQAFLNKEKPKFTGK